MDFDLFILSVGATENETSYNRVKLDELIQKQLREMDDAEREEELEKRRARKDGKQ